MIVARLSDSGISVLALRGLTIGVGLPSALQYVDAMALVVGRRATSVGGANGRGLRRVAPGSAFAIRVPSALCLAPRSWLVARATPVTGQSLPAVPEELGIIGPELAAIRASASSPKDWAIASHSTPTCCLRIHPYS